MQAAVLAGRRRVEVRSVPHPGAPGRGQALVRVTACGICRSDLHYWESGRIGNQVIRRWPQLLGHEPAGRIVALGAGTKGVRVGDRVAIEPALPCGRCAMCRVGRGNLCPRVDFLGMPGQPGAFAQFLVRPVSSLFRIPPAVSDAEAAGLEPLTIGVHAVRLLGVRRVPAAAVIGAGPIGLCVLAALRAMKRTRVIAGDLVPARLRAARRMGAARVIRVSAARPMADQAAAFGKPAVAVEAGGTVASLELAIHAVAPGGLVLVIGIMDGATVPVNLHAARRKELTLINVRRSNGEVREALRLVHSGEVDLRPMLTHTGGLADAARLFRQVHLRAAGAIKAVIVP